VVKTDYKNLTSFLTTKELNRRQVKWAEMLAEYHFIIEHVKGLDNARADALSRKEELQGNNKVSGALLKLDKDGRIQYNHPQLAGTHEAPESSWEQQIKEVQETDPDYKDYKGREVQLKAIYVPNKIAEKFVTEFHKGITQGYNRTTVLIV